MAVPPDRTGRADRGGQRRRALEADNWLRFKNIMSALTTNTRRTNENGATVYPLWGGQSDDVPPPFGGKAFSANHTHYLASNGALEPADVVALVNHITEHGYGITGDGRLVVLVNPAQGEVIRGFKAGVAGSPDDFVNSADGVPR